MLMGNRAGLFGMFILNIKLAYFVLLSIYSYHICRCVAASPSVASFRRYLLLGLAATAVTTVLTYAVQLTIVVHQPIKGRKQHESVVRIYSITSFPFKMHLPSEQRLGGFIIGN